MTSRLGQRAGVIVVGTAIVLLVLLIVLLWTGVGTGVFRQSSQHYRSTVPSGTTVPGLQEVFTSSAPFKADHERGGPHPPRASPEGTTMKPFAATCSKRPDASNECFVQLESGDRRNYSRLALATFLIVPGPCFVHVS
uniref:Uncharacterized protein n=1 Tax=Timema monikensis TaxID=170555 RepID=A0A7R9HNK5_9NEOP|nr:unnamed protein product [Timema monikensis]